MPSIHKARTLYRGRFLYACAHGLTFKERNFQRGFIIALPCACVAAVLKCYDTYWSNSDGDDARIEKFIDSSAAYSSLTFLIGMLIVFRTSQSYQRYWEGCDSAYLMMADFFDAASGLFAFSRTSTAGRSEVSRFQHLIVRLFSMLHALILADLETIGRIDGSEPALSDAVIDPDGIDSDCLLQLRDSTHKVDLVFQWIQSIIMQQSHDGVLNVAPPILTRSFQELNDGMCQFHRALKIAKCPFPFPYTAASEMCLIIHWILVPVVSLSWTDYASAAAALTFMQVFILWSVHSIASELENPFAQDLLDLDMATMQRDMNQRLLMLLEHASVPTPTLSTLVRVQEKSEIECSCIIKAWKNAQTSSALFSQLNAIDRSKSLVIGAPPFTTANTATMGCLERAVTAPPATSSHHVLIQSRTGFAWEGCSNVTDEGPATDPFGSKYLSRDDRSPISQEHRIKSTPNAQTRGLSSAVVWKGMSNGMDDGPARDPCRAKYALHDERSLLAQEQNVSSTSTNVDMPETLGAIAREAGSGPPSEGSIEVSCDQSCTALDERTPIRTGLSHQSHSCKQPAFVDSAELVFAEPVTQTLKTIM